MSIGVRVSSANVQPGPDLVGWVVFLCVENTDLAGAGANQSLWEIIDIIVISRWIWREIISIMRQFEVASNVDLEREGENAGW